MMSIHTHPIFLLWLGISGIITLAFSYFPILAHSENQTDPLFFPNDGLIYGKPYKYWAQKWWEWNLAFTNTTHPNYKWTEEKCGAGQNASSPVWFLVQPWPSPPPDKFDRTCTIPHGKAIITATQAGDCNYGDLESKTDQDLINCAKIGNEGTVIDVTLDNKTYKNYESGTRVLSDFFNAKIIKNNIMDYKHTGTFRAVVDGYYIFLRPPDQGKHILAYKFDTTPPPGISPEYKSYQNGTWNLIIK